MVHGIPFRYGIVQWRHCRDRRGTGSNYRTGCARRGYCGAPSSIAPARRPPQRHARAGRGRSPPTPSTCGRPHNGRCGERTRVRGSNSFANWQTGRVPGRAVPAATHALAAQGLWLLLRADRAGPADGGAAQWLKRVAGLWSIGAQKVFGAGQGMVISPVNAAFFQQGGTCPGDAGLTVSKLDAPAPQPISSYDRSSILTQQQDLAVLSGQALVRTSRVAGASGAMQGLLGRGGAVRKGYRPSLASNSTKSALRASKIDRLVALVDNRWKSVLRLYQRSRTIRRGWNCSCIDQRISTTVSRRSRKR